MNNKNLYISIDSYATEKGEFYDGNAYIDFSIGNRSYRVPLYFDIEKNPHILDIEKHDQAIKNELLNDLRNLARVDTKTLASLFGKFGIRGVLQDCSNEEILSGINEFTSRKNRLKDLLEQNDFSIEEAKQLLED